MRVGLSIDINRTIEMGGRIVYLRSFRSATEATAHKLLINRLPNESVHQLISQHNAQTQMQLAILMHIPQCACP